MHDLTRRSSSPVTEADYFNHHADWHPDGLRIVFSSERRDSGFDLWEQHLPSGLAWRLTDHGGDETEPAWSANGRHLAYIRNTGEDWRLVLRRHGQAEIDLVISDSPLAAPSWRPDGSLLTFLRKRNEAWELQMVILSDPPLVRTLISGEDFFLSPASWLDRQHFYYTANGTIKSRQFNEWTSRPLLFRAEVGHAPATGYSADCT
jgi:Tol biopolymer transport system component